MTGYKSKKLMASQTYDYNREKLIEMSEKERAFVQLEDGFFYWGPTRIGGVISANDLRTLADILDDKNAEWNKHINEYFDKQSNFHCPLDIEECFENCGNYSCGN